MPATPRPELSVLLEVDGDLGAFFWEALTDVNTWALLSPEERPGAFVQLRGGATTRLSAATARAPELSSALHALMRLSSEPGAVAPSEAAEACERVSSWAERAGLNEAAIQFAEAAARLEPDQSPRNYQAGRVCRDFGEPERGRIWLERASRIARLERRDTHFAIAQLGLAVLAHNLSRMVEAEEHCWKAIRAALRTGRKTIAAAGYHELMALMFSSGRIAEALGYAKQAVLHYHPHAPQISLLAHDLAVIWMQMGHYSYALPLLKRISGHPDPPKRMVTLANLARSAAAVQEIPTYEHAAKEALTLADADHVLVPPTLYVLARATHNAGDFDGARQLGERALKSAQAWRNPSLATWIRDFLGMVTDPSTRDRDIPPGPGSGIEEITRLALDRDPRHRKR